MNTVSMATRRTGVAKVFESTSHMRCALHFMNVGVVGDCHRPGQR